jgi:hypothetical protein
VATAATATDMLIDTTNYLRLIKTTIVTGVIIVAKTANDAENKKSPQPRWMR